MQKCYLKVKFLFNEPVVVSPHLMNFLISNDDGINSPSLRFLAETLSAYGKVFCCAPNSEQSGVSQAFTFRKPLPANELDSWPGPTWSIGGTPADCVKLGINELVNEKIDLVITGINLGLNLGVAVVYSGTVGAAREAALWNVPAIAMSVDEWSDEEAIKIEKWIKEFMTTKQYEKIKKGKYWNINFPKADSYELAKTKFCEMGLVMYTDSYENKEGAWTLSGDKESQGFKDPTDDYWHMKGYTTIVPLQIDQTSREEISIGSLILAE